MNRKRILLQLAMILWLLIPFSAEAIVNVEQAIIGPAEDGISTRIDLAVNGSDGNTVKNSTKAELLSQWQHNIHTEFILLKYAFGKSNGTVDTNSAFGHLRHRTQFTDGWAVELLGQLGRDPFARMSQRILLGGGLRWTALKIPKKSAIYLGLGAFHEFEKLNVTSGTTDPLDSKLWRANAYLVLKYQFNDQIRFNNTLYYQPSLRDSTDYRLLEQASALIHLHKNIDLKLSVDFSSDSRPPQTVKSSSLHYSTGITVSF